MAQKEGTRRGRRKRASNCCARSLTPVTRPSWERLSGEGEGLPQRKPRGEHHSRLWRIEDAPRRGQSVSSYNTREYASTSDISEERVGRDGEIGASALWARTFHRAVGTTQKVGWKEGERGDIPSAIFPGPKRASSSRARFEKRFRQHFSVAIIFQTDSVENVTGRGQKSKILCHRCAEVKQCKWAGAVKRAFRK